jgi:hypothetical protein
MFQQNIDKFVDCDTKYQYWEFEEFSYNPISDYKKVISTVKANSFYETEKALDGYINVTLPEINKFKQEAMVNVNYLVKEFEMRKAAESYKRNTVAKMGVIDINKLYSYKINDDIFRKITVTKDGKNHGMIFLLDWSGSMADNIKKTLEQVVTLVLFCSRAQIKYKVFAFANTFYGRVPGSYRKDTTNKIIEVNDASLSLLELFSSEMTSSEMK